MQFPLEVLQQCWFLAGPTACGKSAAALELAERLTAEIVSLDSMAIFRQMDIGTAKPSREDRLRIPHHLTDVVDPHEEYSLAEYVSATENACREILSRGRKPLFVGGTGLYLRGVLRGVFAGPPADWEYRQSLEQAAAQHQPGHLHALLQQIDPASAQLLHANDARRLIRALEVHHLTGVPLSQQQQQQPLPEADRPQHVYWLSPPRGWLYARIDRRVERMIADGLVDEVRKLLAQEQPPGRTARQALGYKEIIEHIENGRSLEESVEQIQTRTRQFAKRQHTWFRNLVECRAVEMTGDETPQELAQLLQTVAEQQTGHNED